MTKTLFVVAILAAAAGAVLQAADINKALADAEGRRRAAESGLRAIKAKSGALGEQVRPAYAEAATRQNAWLEIICQALERPGAAEPDVKAAADAAGASLVAWVAVRNRALGEPELAGPAADSAQTWVVGNLSDIASEVANRNKGTNERQRARTADDLKKRLLWRPWEQIP